MVGCHRGGETCETLEDILNSVIAKALRNQASRTQHSKWRQYTAGPDQKVPCETLFLDA